MNFPASQPAHRLKSVEFEIENLNKTGLFWTELRVEGRTRKREPQRELILFRMIQELLNNTVKHSGASDVSISFHFTDDQVRLQYQDNRERHGPGTTFCFR